jgi:hypothetical protein
MYLAVIRGKLLLWYKIDSVMKWEPVAFMVQNRLGHEVGGIN